MNKERSLSSGRTHCRREFLGKSAAVLAATTLASSALKAQESAAGKSAKKVRIGVVGGGFGCGFHWHEHPNCIVEAVSDLRQDRRDRLMQVYKCNKPYESLEKLILDKDVEAVAMTAPGIVAHQSALQGGKQLPIPCFDPKA